MSDALDDKRARLEGLLATMAPLLVAFSGGVDSALLLAVARRTLGDRVLACIGVSPSYPQREMAEAIRFAQSIGARVRLVETDEHLDDRYAANGPDRCYHCKTHLHRALRRLAEAEGYAAVADGNNASDDSADRPGMKAALEHGVRSPLREAGFTKADVRALARRMGLAVWDKPASPCLSSRVPTGTPITLGLLTRIEKAESALAALGLRQFRVRDRGLAARIQLGPAEQQRLADCRESVIRGVRAAGYAQVIFDPVPLVRE